MLCILSRNIDQKQAGMVVAFVTKVTVSGQTIVRIFISPEARKSATKITALHETGSMHQPDPASLNRVSGSK